MQKVIFIITKLELGGAQKVCLELLFGLKNKNIQTHVITSPGGVLDKELFDKQKVTFIEGLSNSLSPRGIWQNFKGMLKIYRFLKSEVQETPSLIVHTHSSAAGILGRFVAWLAGVKNIVHTIHGFSFNKYQNPIKQTLLTTIEWACAKLSTKLIFVSGKDLQYALGILMIDAKKCTLIRACMQHPTKENSYKKNTLPKSSQTIGTVACFKPQKNLIDLLEIFKTAYENNPNLKLLIVGDGEQRPMIEKFIAQNNLKSVSLLGWQNNLVGFYEQIDVFTLTSLWEGLPCAVVEALVRGIPVVAYDSGGICEVVKNGINGFIVPQLDKKAFLDKLQVVLNNGIGNRKSIGKKLKIEFSASTMIDKHAALYKSILS